MYLWNILQLNKEELVFKFYTAQNLSSDKDDWVHQINKDKSDIDLQLSNKQIANMSQEKFREMVKRKTNIFAVRNLNEIKARHSKTQNLTLSKICVAEYLCSKNLNKEEIQTLYKLRCRMINVKMNSKSFHKENIWCQTCFLFPETQQHLYVCPVLKTKFKHLIDFCEMDQKMIFQSLKRQEKFAKSYHMLLKAREDMLIAQKDGD